jgi:hypothetical protein
MTEIDYFQIIKWVLIVLAAGFIGQFGKSLATYLIKKARTAKAPDRPETAAGFVQEPKEATPSLIPEMNELQGKTEKKASKALIKMRKKENGQ